MNGAEEELCRIASMPRQCHHFESHTIQGDSAQESKKGNATLDILWCPCESSVVYLDVTVHSLERTALAHSFLEMPLLGAWLAHHFRHK